MTGKIVAKPSLIFKCSELNQDELSHWDDCQTVGFSFEIPQKCYLYIRFFFYSIINYFAHNAGSDVY